MYAMLRFPLISNQEKTSSYSTKEPGSSDILSLIHFYTSGLIELLSLLCTLENFSNCMKIPFDSDSFLKLASMGFGENY